MLHGHCLNHLADRGYDTDEIIAYAMDAGMNVVIPPKSNRKEQREYNRYLYKLRHLASPSFGECIPLAKTLERYRHQVCKVFIVFFWLLFKYVA